MMYSELLQVIAASSLLTLALALLLSRFSQRIRHGLERYLRPRYLKSRGVRRRTTPQPAQSEPHEPS
ncbi:cellulose biosynthesis protein BcsF [Pseudomonas sp. QTF5]|uniref:cellulose biosynthesis protein BcsF n=1 Tax=Pseudomonas sp. QTF5 TaxID=1435425 RepID=UPI0004BBC71C|nr:cellulose biosynthesis protein BcsF [Pseudomonas sp. QTF5]